ncbi:MAG TPA: sulfatase-like hydrolase/transferase [Thermoanaerobaculia bacterium]|nr:sulfatase-like hydrolase/transferase [Thermoanaerobaculia bacterium]
MRGWCVLLGLLLVACGETPAPQPPPPSILLVTLDTTRADAIGAHTPAFNALAARGRVFRYAYATAPQTLPSHASMMTGLYPAGHGVHENARALGAQHALLAEKLRGAGYRTAAFVSGFPLARQFGLARGFDVYDDAFELERSARETTDRAIAWLRSESQRPLFVWVHYYDPHDPYEPPEPYASRFADKPYLGEVAAMDEQLGRLVQAFGDGAIAVVADHGEGLGDHGESQHGYLLYQSAMHVPLVLAGPGVARGTSDAPVSARRVFHTILDWAGHGEEGGRPVRRADETSALLTENSLRAASTEVVLGEAMAPFLDFGWQPQVMAVEGREKVISAGAIERYDVVADPREAHDLGGSDMSRSVRKVLSEYPLPSPAAAVPTNLSEEERRKFASLGYITSVAKPVIRKDAPRPRDMTHLFDELETASDLFVAEEWSRASVVLEKILAEDPHNLTAALRLAAAHSRLGQNDRALAAFKRAEAIAPDSPDVRLYLALHLARTSEWERAVPMLERSVAESPDRLSALETLGDLAMRQGRTNVAIDAYERARALQGARFEHHLELGVLYLAARRYAEARDALDRVPANHPAWPMALFKRAQVSVLLNEPDRAARIARARQYADATTRDLIAEERLFR